MHQHERRTNQLNEQLFAQRVSAMFAWERHYVRRLPPRLQQRETVTKLIDYKYKPYCVRAPLSEMQAETPLPEEARPISWGFLPIGMMGTRLRGKAQDRIFATLPQISNRLECTGNLLGVRPQCSGR